MKRLATALALLTVLPDTAAAQAPDDPNPWVMTRAREGNTVMATATFSNGITVISRCSHRTLDLILAGLPPAPESDDYMRMLTLLIDDDVEDQPISWHVASDPTAAFSRLPAAMTRRLAQGGRLQIIVPAPSGGRRTRYVMDLTPSSSMINEVLTHCDKPLSDPDDAVTLGTAGTALPSMFVWVRRPQPQYPEATVHGFAPAGEATISCEVRTDGRLADCKIESEFPVSGGFGTAARRAAGEGRIRLSDQAVAAGETMEPGRRINFNVSFRVLSD